MPSHGSLTKAGKVRAATPKIPPKPKESPHPIQHIRGKYFKRIVYPQLAAAKAESAEQI